MRTVALVTSDKRTQRHRTDWRHWQAGLLVPALVVVLSVLIALPGLWF